MEILEPTEPRADDFFLWVFDGMGEHAKKSTWRGFRAMALST
jgi:hypothetical protein